MENEENKVILEEENSSGIGAVLGAIIIITVILIGGWYFLVNRSERIKNQKQEAVDQNATTTEFIDTETITVQN